MKKFLVYVDKQPSFYLEVSPKTKIKEIKESLKQYKILELRLNKKESLSVFNTNQYDNMNISSKFDKIDDNASIFVIVDKKIEKLSKDTLGLIALELDFPSLLKFCSTNKEINEKVCRNKNFWRNRLQRDFPIRSSKLEKNNPEELYKRLVNEKSKIITITKKEAPLTYSFYIENDQEDDLMSGEPEHDDQVIKEINKDMLSNKIVAWPGDILYFKWVSDYRNDGKVLWNGVSAVALGYDVDEYGYVSSHFSYPEYPPDYFYGSIDHNSYFWTNEEMINEIINNYDGKSKSFVVDKIRGTTYQFKFWPDEDEEGILPLETLKLFLSKLKRENGKILMSVHDTNKDEYIFYVYSEFLERNW